MRRILQRGKPTPTDDRLKRLCTERAELTVQLMNLRTRRENLRRVANGETPPMARAIAKMELRSAEKEIDSKETVLLSTEQTNNLPAAVGPRAERNQQCNRLRKVSQPFCLFFPSHSNDKTVLLEARGDFDGQLCIRSGLHKPARGRWISQRSRFDSRLSPPISEYLEAPPDRRRLCRPRRSS